MNLYNNDNITKEEKSNNKIDTKSNNINTNNNYNAISNNKFDNYFIKNSNTTNNIKENINYDLDINYSDFIENNSLVKNFEYKSLKYSCYLKSNCLYLTTSIGQELNLIKKDIFNFSQNWKFHISISVNQIQLAWNLISSLFIKKECWEGMRTVVYSKEINKTNLNNKGKEIVIDIFRYSNEFNCNKQKNNNKLYDNSCIEENDNMVKIEFNSSLEKSENFWLEMFLNIENTLKSNNVMSNGTAIGDLKLGNYISLKNVTNTIHKDSNLSNNPLYNLSFNNKNSQLPFDIYRFRFAYINNWYNLKNIDNDVNVLKSNYFYNNCINNKIYQNFYNKYDNRFLHNRSNNYNLIKFIVILFIWMYMFNKLKIVDYHTII